MKIYLIFELHNFQYFLSGREGGKGGGQVPAWRGGVGVGENPEEGC